MRYEATCGPNTKQFWLYDNENDTYIDPPSEVLEEIDKIAYPENGKSTADTISAAENRLEEIANAEDEPDWLHDGYEYDAEELEI